MFDPGRQGTEAGQQDVAFRGDRLDVALLHMAEAADAFRKYRKFKRPFPPPAAPLPGPPALLGLLGEDCCRAGAMSAA
jgi:hypothetical protein